MTTTGEKIMDVELTDHNCSEVLRIFIKARNCKENEVHIKLFSLFLITETVRTLLKVISIIQCLCHKVVGFTDVFSHLVHMMDYLYYRIRIQIPNLKGTLYSAELVHIAQTGIGSLSRLRSPIATIPIFGMAIRTPIGIRVI